MKNIKYLYFLLTTKQSMQITMILSMLLIITTVISFSFNFVAINKYFYTISLILFCNAINYIYYNSRIVDNIKIKKLNNILSLDNHIRKYDNGDRKIIYTFYYNNATIAEYIRTLDYNSVNIQLDDIYNDFIVYNDYCYMYDKSSEASIYFLKFMKKELRKNKINKIKLV